MSSQNNDLDDLDEIELSLDSLNWPSGGSLPQWNLTGGSVGSVGSVNAGGQSYYFSQPSVPSNLSLNFSVGAATVKTDIQYVIVLDDGFCLDLIEQTPITPREIVGLSKLMNMVTVFMNSHNVRVVWSEVIEKLGIRRHFSPGLSSMHQYATDSETLYVFLIDDQ